MKRKIFSFDNIYFTLIRFLSRTGAVLFIRL